MFLCGCYLIKIFFWVIVVFIYLNSIQKAKKKKQQQQLVISSLIPHSRLVSRKQTRVSLYIQFVFMPHICQRYECQGLHTCFAKTKSVYNFGRKLIYF